MVFSQIDTVHKFVNQLFFQIGTEFRSQLVEFEKDYSTLRQRCMELETRTLTKDKEVARLEKANRMQERRLEELSRALKDMEKENQLLGMQVISFPFI